MIRTSNNRLLSSGRYGLKSLSVAFLSPFVILRNSRYLEMKKMSQVMVWRWGWRKAENPAFCSHANLPPC